MSKKTDIKTTDEQLPAYIKQGSDRGNENVTVDDIQLPRIDVIQALSPQLNKKKDKYIEGAEVGDLFNTLTNEIYGTKVPFTPVQFGIRYFVWIDRKKDSAGGLCGIFDTMQEADSFLNHPDQESEKAKMEIVPTAEHLVILDDGTEIILSMGKSKMKVSRKLNSLIRLLGGDRFSRRYLLSSIEDSSRKGEYQNFTVDRYGFPSEATYNQAEKLYNDLASKEINLSADYSDVTDQGNASSDDQEEEQY